MCSTDQKGAVLCTVSYMFYFNKKKSPQVLDFSQKRRGSV